MPRGMSLQVTRSRVLRFYFQDCIECGTPFGMLDDLNQERRRDQRTFYCPNGHPQIYSEGIEDQLRQELEEARQATANARRSLAAAKRTNTTLRQRVKAGVCIECHRHFENVERHMASRHPGFAAGE